jgi:adenylate kinase family enzyme
MIVNLRGTSGSGKTTVVRGLMEKYPSIRALGPEKKPEGYECLMANFPGNPPPLYVVGSYKNVCGGCDGIKTQDEICDRVRRYAGLFEQGYELQLGTDQAAPIVSALTGPPHVVFEGLLISHLYSRYLNLDREMKDKFGQHTIWAFLDTPEEVCVDRVKDRRARRHAEKVRVKLAQGKPAPPELGPLNEKNTRQKWHDMRRVYQKCQRDGLDARWLDHTNPIEQTWDWLRG